MPSWDDFDGNRSITESEEMQTMFDNDEDDYDNPFITLPKIADKGLALSSRIFGLELETSKKVKCPKGWTWHYDGSVSGLEYVLGPVGGKKGETLLKEGCAQLSANGNIVDRRCGFHLHINARDLTEKQVFGLYNFCYAYQREFYSFVAQSRFNNSYCRVLPRPRKNLEKTVYFYYDDDDDMGYSCYDLDNEKADKYSDARYSWANFHSYYYRGTIEIRLHHGTTNINKVLNWVELWLKLTDFISGGGTYLNKFGKPKSIWTIMSAAKIRRKTIRFFKQRKKEFYGSAWAPLTYNKNSNEYTIGVLNAVHS